MSTPLPQDARLPHLARALDAAAMQAHFAAEPTLAPGWRVARCEVDRIKYRPGRNLAVSYRLCLQHSDCSVVQQFVATRWCAPGESLARWTKATAQALAASATGPTVTHHAALDLVAHWWPHDPKLKATAALADEAALQQRWLPEVAQALAGPGARLAQARVELVQLVPEHRATARVLLVLAAGPRHTVYAKADAEGRGPATQAAMQQLWDSPARHEGRLVVPQPLLWQAGSGLHWQCAVEGRPLLDVAPQLGDSDADALGRLLAALHGTPVAMDRVETLAGLQQRLDEVVATLSQVLPAQTSRLQSLAQALQPGLRALADAPPVTLHGDLHPRNVLRAPDGRLGLIDLDSLRQGPALLDLGAWAADALYRAQLDGRPAHGATPALLRLAQAYAQAGGAAATPAQLAWATAWQLLCQRAWRCAVNLKPGRFALVAPLLDTAQQLLMARAWPSSARATAPREVAA